MTIDLFDDRDAQYHSVTRSSSWSRRAEQLRRTRDSAHLLGRLASARHFIANVWPVVDGRIEALKWMEVSACTLSEASF